MKKLIIPVLVLCLLCMAACGGSDGAAQPAAAPESAPVDAGESAAAALVDALRDGGGDSGDTADGALPDPGGLLNTSAVQLEDQTVNGTVFHVYEYAFSVQNGISSTQRSFYESRLKQSGYTMQALEPDNDLSYYLISGEDSTATLTVTRASAAGKAVWTLYVPEDMPFYPSSAPGTSDGVTGNGLPSGGISGSSFQNDSYLPGGITGGSFQNDSYLPGGITGGSFQNGSYTDGAEEPVVVDGMIICTECDGDGICPYCHGVGKVKYDLQNYETCVVCDGDGVCTVCGGTGNWGPA